MGKPDSSKAPLAPASAKPSSGTEWPPPASSPTSLAKVSIEEFAAASAFAIDSVEGQRSRPSEVTRLDLLKVVGSSPARLARPDGDKPARAASRCTPDLVVSEHPLCFGLPDHGRSSPSQLRKTILESTGFPLSAQGRGERVFKRTGYRFAPGNASKQEFGAPLRFHRNGNGSKS